MAVILSKSGSPDLWVANIDGSGLRQLTTTHEPESSPCWSPDGRTLCFASTRDGKAALFTVPAAGGEMHKLSTGGIIPATEPDWSPDGKWIVYISFPTGTVKHPADKDVILRRMKPDGSEQADILAFNGGQGTINVNSWSPDSKRFAFVMYEVGAK